MDATMFTVAVDLRFIVTLLRDADSDTWTQFRVDHALPEDAVLIHAWTDTNGEWPYSLKLRFCSPSGGSGTNSATPMRRWPNPAGAG